jgi:cyanobactin maturation PatA/PatG family protease
MPAVNDRPAHPGVAEEMVTYLGANPSESTKLIWTFNLELTPIYAIEAEVPYAREVYEFLRKALTGQVQKENSPDYVSRVSLPGLLSSRTVRLYSGQVVPLVVAQYRGLWSWSPNALVETVTGRFDAAKHENVRASLQNFLDKVYYELRNLGQSSPDRALNFSATNAFQATDAMCRALNPKHAVPGAGVYTLDRNSVSKSPFCRMDSDCWDVKLTFFDAENERRARMVMRFTVDVSDELPVTLGPVRHWAESSACC